MHTFVFVICTTTFVSVIRTSNCQFAASWLMKFIHRGHYHLKRIYCIVKTKYDDVLSNYIGDGIHKFSEGRCVIKINMINPRRIINHNACIANAWVCHSQLYNHLY